VERAGFCQFEISLIYTLKRERKKYSQVVGQIREVEVRQQLQSAALELLRSYFLVELEWHFDAVQLVGALYSAQEFVSAECCL
jgi:hypothetical protein